MPEEAATIDFSSELPLIILVRPMGGEIDWQEVDRGPGFFHIPADQDIRVRIKGINDWDLNQLVGDLQEVKTLRFLDLAENRNVTNEGIAKLKALPQLTGLNLSSCSVTNNGLAHLKSLPRLSTLILTYCKLSDPVLKTLEGMKSLTYVDLQGCLGFTHAGLARVRRRTLTIYR